MTNPLWEEGTDLALLSLPPRVFNPIRRAGYMTLGDVERDLEAYGELAFDKDGTRIGRKTHERLLQILRERGILKGYCEVLHLPQH